MNMSPFEVSEMLAKIRAAIARRNKTDEKAAAERRRPENAHYRALWDAKQRAADAGDMEAYARIDQLMTLYRIRPETAAAVQPSVTPPGLFCPSSEVTSESLTLGGVAILKNNKGAINGHVK